MLGGEPGIGKTRIVQQFAMDAREIGATILWGQCLEGDWTPPYGPWVDALTNYVRSLDRERLHAELDVDGPPLARLVPALRALVPGLPAAVTLGPDDERLRLYDAVTRLLLRAGAGAPAVLVLDDLHWADRDSLSLLRYVLRFAGRGRLLVVGTYRTTDLGRHHPLHDVLAAVARQPGAIQVTLGGLSRDDVGRYLALIAGHDVPDELVHAIHTETDGNPFYVSEVFKHLAEEVRRSTCASAPTMVMAGDRLPVPPSVRQVVGQRLARLSEAATQLLQYAAVCGPVFRFETLQALSDLPEDVLLDALDETLRAGLIRELGTPDGGERYAFAHDILRHTVYEELNGSRRARLHRRVAEALARDGACCDLHGTADVAAQYHASRSLPGAAAGVPYALAAAEQARDHAAHEQAVSFLRMARDLAAEAEPAVRADVLCRLAVAEAEALLLVEAEQTVEAALAALTAAGAPPREVAAFLAAGARALKDGGAPQAAWEPLVRRGLALVGERHDLLWARLVLLLEPMEPLLSGELTAWRWLGHDPEAVAIARREGDEDDYARTLEPFDWRTREETDALLALARSWTRPTAILRALEVVVDDLISRHGAFRDGLDCAHEMLRTAERYGSIAGQGRALVFLGRLQATFGDLAEAQRTVQRARELARELGSAHRVRFWALPELESGLAYLTSGTVAAPPSSEERPQAQGGGGSSWRWGLARAAQAVRYHSLAGNAGHVRRLLAELTPVLERADLRLYGFDTAVMVAATAVWELPAAEFAPAYHLLLRRLLAAGMRNPAGSSLELACARMVALLGDVGEAEEAFHWARRELERDGRRPLRAMVDYDEALALLRAGSAKHERIAALLDAALAAFREIGMPRWEQRARSLRETLVLHGGLRTCVADCNAARLTAREVEVLQQLIAGKTNKEIAQALTITINTLEQYLTTIYAKIGVHRRAEAIVYAIDHGLRRSAPGATP